jgi:hypothetical protein
MKQFLQKLTAVFLMFATCNFATAQIVISPVGGGGGTPGGSDTYVQYNDGGVFGGESVFTYNKTTNVLTAGSLELNNASFTVPINGVYYSAADSLGFSTDGTQRGHVDDSGNWMFGATTVAQGKVTIQGNGSTTGKALVIRSTTAGGTTTAYIQENGVFNQINTSASGYGSYTIEDSTSGTYRLTQIGQLGTSYAGYGILTANGGFFYSTSPTLSIGTDHASGVIKFATGTGLTEKMRLSAAGGFGVGTTTDPGAGNIIATRFYFTSTVFMAAGTGTPEGSLTAGIGSTFHRTDGGALTSFYVKESGTGNTGWVAK